MAHVTTRAEHPWPAMAMHWLHLICIAVLTFTGFYIHDPFFAGSMGTMRMLHFLFMFVLIFTAVVRVWWAFLGRGSAGPGETRLRRDYTHFFPERRNRRTTWQTLKYYLFLRRTHPRTAKYNPLQKATYASWLLLIALQAVTGFALWSPTQYAFLPLTYFIGGSEAMRALHYLIMWLFIASTLIHIYLSLAEAPWEFPLMFWGRETRPRTVERQTVVRE